MVPVKFDKDGLPIPQKVSFDKEGLPVPVKKKEVSEPILPIGGKAGTSEVPLGGEKSPKKLTYNDLEKLYVDVNEADKNLFNLKKSQITSAGIGAAPAIIPQSQIDQATAKLSQAQRKKEETISEYRTELDAPVKRLINTGEYKQFFDADIFNSEKARNHFQKIAQKYGGGSYLIDSWTAALKKEGQFEKDKPRFSNLFEEELSKVGFSTDSIAKMKEEAGQKLFDRLAKNQYDNVGLIKKDAEAEVAQAETQAKQQVQTSSQKFNEYVNGLNQNLKARIITPTEASEMYDAELQKLNNGVQEINTNYLDLVRNVNTRVNKKYGRIEQEIKRISQSITDADILKELPEEDRNKIKFATNRAAVRLQNEKNDVKKAALEATTKFGLPGPGASEWATNLSNSFLSGFNQGLANLGDWLHSEGANNKVVDWMRDRSSTAAEFAPPKYEWNKDEWLNRAITSAGTSLGASAPALLPTIAVGAVTGGAGLLPSALATGTASFAIENAQNAGQQYQQKLEETGDPNIAKKSANDLFRKNTIALPLYFVGGLGDMMLLKGGALTKKLTGFALEQSEEVPTEYIQSYNEAKVNGYKGSIGDYIKENPEIAYDTILSTIGQGSVMGSVGEAFSSFSKKLPESSSQFFANMVQKEGIGFAQKALENYYTKGIIDKAEYENQKAKLDNIASDLQELDEVGVEGNDAILMTSLTQKLKELESKANTVQSDAVKAYYQRKISEVKSDINELSSKQLPYVVFTMPGGQEDARVMTVKEFQALTESEANELIKNSDGVQVVNDDALNTSLTDKKKQLGIPKDAPEGAYPNNEPVGEEVAQVPAPVEEVKAEVVGEEVAPQVPAAPIEFTQKEDAKIKDIAIEANLNIGSYIKSVPTGKKNRFGNDINKYEATNPFTNEKVVFEKQGDATDYVVKEVSKATTKSGREEIFNSINKKVVGEEVAAPQVPAAPVEELPFGETAPREVKETKEETNIKKRALNIEPLSPLVEVMQYFISGGKINPSALEEFFGKETRTGMGKINVEERRSRTSLTDSKAPSIDELAEKLTGADRTEQFREFRDAIEEVLLNHSGTKSMSEELVKDYDIDYQEQKRLAELEDINKEVEDETRLIVSQIPEAQQEEILRVLDKFRDNQGFIDWRAIASEYESGFEPVLLELSEPSQKIIEDAIKQIQETGRVSSISAKPLQPEAKAGDAARRLAERIRQGKISKLGGFRAGTGFDAVWDASLEVIAKALEGGASVADAIEQGLKYAKSTGWYKKLTNPADFDKKYREQLNEEYNAIQERTAGEVPVQPEAGVSEEVEAEVPGAESKKATQEGEGKGEEKRLSGIKKGLVSKEVLQSVDLDRTGDKKLLMAGRQIIESGEVEPKLLIDKIIDEGKGVLSPAEVVALITYKADLDTKVEDLSAEIEQLEAAGEDIGTKGVELKNLEVEQRNFEIAAVITAQQQSMSFRLRRWMLDRTYSLQQQIAQYKKANGGTIPSDVLQQFEKMDAEIQELKKQIKEAEIRKVDEEGQVAVDNIIDDVKREDARTLTDEEVDAKVQKGVQEEIDKIYEKLPAKRKSRADEAITALEKIQKRLRSRTYDASIGIPVAIIDMGITTIKNAIKAGVAIEKAIELGIDKIKEKLKGKPFDNEAKFRQDLLDGFKAEGVKTEKEVAETPSVNDDGTINIPEKFLRDLVRKGVNTIEELTDAAFKELESQLPGLTKRQVRDAITQYGRTVNPTQDEIRQQLATAKRLGRLISELEDLKSMSKAEFALKYFKQPTPSKITEAEKNLKKQINSLARDLKTDAQVLAQAKESAKRRIEELQRRLKEKDYSSRPKKLVKADAELEILLGKKQALQDKFEEAKKKAELKNRTLGQRIEDILLEIFSGISRALVAGLDLSAAFVQGTRRVFTNPKMSAKAFAEGLRQFASPTRMERFMQRYKGTYNYSVARNSGLAISDVDGTLSAKEQIFVTNWANTIYDLIASVVTLGHKPSAEFIKRINPLKASQRAFDGYMNYIRISSFETEMAALKNMGYTPDSNPEVYKAAADFVNTATGRANMGPLEASSKWLSVIMFAPRKTVSEFKLYSPLAFLYYAYMPAPVRKRALIDFAKFSASVLVTHVLVKAAIDTYEGDEEDYEDFWNPDSPNFLAFKIGDKRISFLGGIKSMIVFMSRLFGQDFVDQYGITTKFGERYGKKIDTKLDLATQFLLGKASPGTGAIRDYLDKNPNYENDDEILQNLVVPMWIQDAKELYKEDPAAVTAMFNMLAIVGANIRKVDMKQVQDQIIFKEKVKGKEVKRIVELTDAQKEEFQNLVKQRAKIELAKIAPIVKNEKSGSKRAEYDKMAIDQAKKDAQKLLEKRYIKIFRQFPVQEKEQDKLMEKVKKKLK